MDVVAGAFLASCALLAVAGVPKLADPRPTVRALRSARLRVPPAAVRAGAALEASLGVAAALTGSRPAAALVAASYGAFTGFVLLARARGGVLASCGCLGRADTPPTRTHVAVTAGYAAAAVAAAAWPAGPLPTLLGRSPGHGLPLLLLAGAAAYLSYLVLAVLPTVRPVPREA